MTKRHNKKWNVNEELALQREYELLEWTIKQIALKHERSDKSILFKLQKEGFIENWVSARGFDECNLDVSHFIEKNDDLIIINNLQTHNNELSERVEILEKSIFEFKIILNKLLNDTTQIKSQTNIQHLEL
jgi:hypothetical protein